MGILFGHSGRFPRAGSLDAGWNAVPIGTRQALGVLLSRTNASCPDEANAHRRGRGHSVIVRRSAIIGRSI
jgi:hypothetical protein